MGETNWVIIFPVPINGHSRQSPLDKPTYHIKLSMYPYIPLYPMIFPYVLILLLISPCIRPLIVTPNGRFTPPLDPFLPLSKRGCGRSEATKPWVRSLGTMADGGGHRLGNTLGISPTKNWELWFACISIHSHIYVFIIVYYIYTD
jgi:hypothetical protein